MKFRTQKITALMVAAIVGVSNTWKCISNGSRKYRSNGGSGRSGGNGG